MAGLKTNEREGTRAVLRHARVSPYKVREVLDLVRGKPVHEAEDILRFSERDAAFIVGKVLRSAVANAENNDELDPEELYVSACFADEGTTIKRWRPRARGRATRIRKRTSHITVIVEPHAGGGAAAPAGPAPGRAAGPAGPPGRRRPPGRGRSAVPGRAPARSGRRRRATRGGRGDPAEAAEQEEAAVDAGDRRRSRGRGRGRRRGGRPEPRTQPRADERSPDDETPTRRPRTRGPGPRTPSLAQTDVEPAAEASAGRPQAPSREPGRATEHEPTEDHPTEDERDEQ